MRTQSDGDYLLAAILDHPEDDDCRLVYADWLEDEGKSERAHAAFIRYQMQFRDGVVPGGPHQPLTFTTTCGTYHVVGHFPWVESIGVRRGFVEKVVCTLNAWQKHGPALVRAHPVTRVECTDAFAARNGLTERWGVVFDHRTRTTARAMDDALSQVGWHDTEAACNNALSVALIAWAKENARAVP